MIFDPAVRRTSSRVFAAVLSTLVLAASVAQAQTAPVAVNDGPFSVDEGASLAGSPSVLTNDSDADPGDILTVSVLTTPSFDASFSLNPTTGVIGYTHNGSETTADSFTYEVCDDEVPAQCDSATVSFTINPINDPPNAVNDSANVNEDTSNNPINVTANDTDAEGNTLTVTTASTSTGSVTPSGGNVLYTPPANFVGNATVNYTISDGNGGSDSAVLTVTVDNVNDPPVAVDDTASVNEDSSNNSINVAGNDTDIDGDTLTVSAASTSTGGVTFSGPNVSYTPPANFTGEAIVNYTISDGNGGTDGGVLTVTVINQNDPPVANPDTLTVNEDTANNPVNVLANDTDADNDPLSVTAVSAGNGTVSILGNNTVRYTPDANYFGADTINYTISDGNGGTDSSTVSVTVNNVNDPPVANNDTASVDEDSTNNVINVAANDTDVDGDALTVSAASTATGSVTFSGSNVSYTPPANFAGQATINYTISDGNGGTDSAVVTVTVTSQNDPPVANDDAAAVQEDSSNNLINVTANDTDPDGDALTVSAASTATGSVTFSGGNVSYTPPADFNGQATINYTVSDGNGGTDSAVVTVTVTNVNDPPVANDDTASVDEDSTNNVINVAANDTDVDGDTLTVSAASTETGSVTFSGGNVSYTPPADFNGQATINYTISDGNGGTDSAVVTVTVTNQNDPPVANDDAATVQEDSSNNIIDVTANDTDPDGDALTVSAASTATGSVTFSGGNVSYTPPPDFSGEATINYTVSDGNGGTDTAVVTVTVNNVNDAPVITGLVAPLSTPEDTPLTITVSDLVISDPDNVFPADFTLVLQDGVNYTRSGLNGNTITPAENFNGTLSVPATVSDLEPLASAVFNIPVTVSSENDVPAADLPIEPQTAIEGSLFELDVSGNFSDADGDPLTFSATGLPPSMSINSATGLISGTPRFEEARDNEPYPIIVTAQDPFGEFATNEFDLTVSALNRANLALLIDVNSSSASPAEDLRWTFSAVNPVGPQAGQNVELTGNFVGSGLTVTAETGANCTIDPPAGNLTAFSCVLGSLPVGATVSTVLTTATGQASEIVVFATAAGRDNIPIDPNEDDNSAFEAAGVAEAFSNGAVQILGTASVRAVTAGDLDGDGRADIVVGTQAGQRVQIFFGDVPREACDCPRDFIGAGVPVGSTATNEGVALADFDGDGSLDIVVANGGGLADFVYFNDGTGDFGVLPAFNLGTSFAQGVAVGDFNGDGNADIAVAAVGGNPVYLGDGAGGFALEGTLGTANSTDVAAARLDGDNLDDLVFANTGGPSQVWLRNTAGGFSAGSVLTIGDASSVVAANLDGIGGPDLVFGRVPADVSDIPSNPVLLNDGAGGFGAPAQSLGFSPTNDVEVGEFNGDGLADIVFINASGVHQVWTAGPTGYVLHREQIIDGGARAGVVADLGFTDNGNPGGSDLAMGGASLAGIGVYLNDGAGNLGRGDAVPPVIELRGQAAVEVASGSVYSDAGATALDNIDGDISAAIVVTGSVNTAVVGSYTLTYNVQDFAGNPAVQVVRNVSVTPAVGTGGGGGGSLSIALLVALLGVFVSYGLVRSHAEGARVTIRIRKDDRHD